MVAARAGDEGKLFGSIGIADVAEAISKFTGYEVDRTVIRIPGPIKEIGLHEVTGDSRTKTCEFNVTLDVIPA